MRGWSTFSLPLFGRFSLLVAVTFVARVALGLAHYLPFLSMPVLESALLNFAATLVGGHLPFTELGEWLHMAMKRACFAVLLGTVNLLNS